MVQRWHTLLFAHWPCEPDRLRPLVPARLELDLHDGTAWIGIVPFLMSGVRLRGLPPVPSAHVFPELNVRTYVRHGDKAGVWFFSLDAASALAVIGARAAVHLPYFRAWMRTGRSGARVHYQSVRTGSRPAARFVAEYEPVGPVYEPVPGTLDHWLTERYCLYSASPDGRRLWRLEIHHHPWPLQPARAIIPVNSMARAAGLPLAPADPLLHYAHFQDVRAWAPQRIV